MRLRVGSLVVATVAMAGALTACSVLTPGSSTEPGMPEVAATGSAWTGIGVSGFYMVSDQVSALCPNGEEFLSGDGITGPIPPASYDSLDGYACVFTAPMSGNPDEVDEIAYHVDSGLGDLVRAYAQTTNYVDGQCPDPVTSDYPFVRVEFEGVGYTVLAGGCHFTPDLDDALAALRVTQVVRDTVTAEEAEQAGF